MDIIESLKVFPSEQIELGQELIILGANEECSKTQRDYISHHIGKKVKVFIKTSSARCISPYCPIRKNCFKCEDSITTYNSCHYVYSTLDGRRVV